MTDELETAREEYLNSNESAFDAFGAGWRRGRASLEEALGELFKLVEDGVLVRDISRDGEPGWAMKQLQLVMVLKKVEAALAGKSGEVGNVK